MLVVKMTTVAIKPARYFPTNRTSRRYGGQQIKVETLIEQLPSEQIGENPTQPEENGQSQEEELEHGREDHRVFWDTAQIVLTDANQLIIAKREHVISLAIGVPKDGLFMFLATPV